MERGIRWSVRGIPTSRAQFFLLLFPPLLLLSLIKSREGGRPGHAGNAWFLEESTLYAPPSRISAVVRVN